LATVYASGRDGLAVRAPEGAKGQGHYVDGPRKSFAGGAGLLSTARDYARFLEMTRNGGMLDGVRIMSPRTAMLMRTNQSGTLHSQTGLGLVMDLRRRIVMGPTAWMGWALMAGAEHTEPTIVLIPRRGLTLVLMIQQIPNSTDIGRKFPALVYQALIN
jgi:CubicO group peptidase (beta-lactamase class C family)